MSERFNTMENHLKELKEENATLKSTVKVLNDENTALKNKLHDVELHTRSNTVRIFNFSPINDDYSFETLSDQLYDEVFLPILRGASGKKRLKGVPSKDRLILSAHPLPGRDGKPPPIICRLLNGYYRTIILQCQKEFGRRSESPNPRDTSRPPPLCHPIFEDTTSELYRFKQRLAAHEGVAAAWIAGGAVRFKLVNSDTVKKVRNIFEPIEDIVAS